MLKIALDILSLIWPQGKQTNSPKAKLSNLLDRSCISDREAFADTRDRLCERAKAKKPKSSECCPDNKYPLE